ncbi:uncharacterized protein C8orf59 homolog isoform X2 [Carlito syrichta]|uniref:Uncharacterized protein C8orf59 homolog isoform X2 n=1 Tax=Carlito syrichta TaxID=1868482 RepID=A0A3Q0EG59_CARSF|nr:uncharacterized protein C8orf59 homolog isoform X2 [Carlito syrichta]
MAKNKFLEQQTRIISVLQMAGQKHFKPKNKAKPVTTDLKKIPQQCHESKPVNVDEATR